MKRITKALTAVMLMMAMVFAVGCKPEEENDGIDGSLNGHDYVDLGLPSGTLWATCNVGADAPEDYGDYFAWGETTPKTIYNWSTYQYCNGDDQQLTKYCNNVGFGYNGFTDDKAILRPKDDAATANWGSGWCMPTYQQWLELQQVHHTWTTQNGVSGRLFTAHNGNSIFLPAAGMRSDDELISDGRYGFYWSNMIHNYYNCSYACRFAFRSGNYHIDSGERCCGRSVRPVVRSAL